MDWIADSSGKVLVKYVGRFESLNEDFKHVCELIGRSVELPHLKQSRRDDYRKYYDDDSAAVVASWFRRDISSFNYAF
jgi:hypothetical protein